MALRSNKILIVLLSLVLAGAIGASLWFVQQEFVPEEARANPRVLQALPGGPALVSRMTTVEILFDQQMDHGAVQDALAVSPAFTFDTEWLAEGSGERLILRPRHPLEWNTAYTITLGVEAINRYGRALENPATLELQTGTEVRVEEILPQPGARDVDVDSPLMVRFDSSLVEVTSLEGQDDFPQPVKIEPPVQGMGRWLAPDLYAFYPTGGFSRGTAYRVSLSSLVAPGVELPEPVSWSFVTVDPRIEAMFPYSGANEVGLATSIKLLFAQPMNRETVEDSFRLSAHGIDVPIAGEFQWQDDETLEFVPSAPLEVATEYQVEVGEAARAQGGLWGLPATYRSRFTTVDYLAIDSVQPAPGTIEVSVSPTDTAIAVQFNHPVVELVGEAGRDLLRVPIDIMPALQGEGEWVTTSLFLFRPARPLEPSTEYVVSVDDELQDVLGAPLHTPYAWSFVTEFPAVLRVEPENPRQHVAPEGPFGVRFNQPMERRSSQAAFSLVGADGPVGGTFRWNQDSTLLQLVPSHCVATPSIVSRSLRARSARRVARRGSLSRLW
jgi:hypothetical protein